MKIENTLENKSKFFAQYWYQDVFVFVPNMQTYKITKSRFNAETLRNPCYLQLKPLESISDEDAIAFFDIVWAKVGSHKNKPNDFKIEFGKDWASSPTSERYGLIPTGLFHGVDWLRSKSYALPWMGLSVQDLIDYGWIKIKE